jgi:hypothetical protein
MGGYVMAIDINEENNRAIIFKPDNEVQALWRNRYRRRMFMLLIRKQHRLSGS